MNCNKCGAWIPEGCTFCPMCGTEMEPAAPAAPEAPHGTGVAVNSGYNNPAGSYAPAGAYTAQKSKKKKSSGKAIGLIAGIVALAAVAVVAIVLLNRKPYLNPIEQMFKALNNNDYVLLGEATTQEVYDDLSPNIDYSMDEGVSPDYTYTVLSSRELEGTELSTARSEYGGNKFYAVDVTISFYNPYYEDTVSESGTILVGKVRGKWIVCDEDY